MDSDFDMVDIGKAEDPAHWSQPDEDLPNNPLLSPSSHCPEKTTFLPRKRQLWLFRIYRHARYLFFTTYRRIYFLIIIVNVTLVVLSLSRKSRNRLWSTPLILEVSDAASLNMTAAILMRQDYIINILFRISWSVPFSTPLLIRRRLAKIYEYGCVHSATAVCSVLYYSLLTYLLFKEFKGLRIVNPRIQMATYVILGLVWAIMITSYPKFRSVWHNTFEHVHRWGGWIIIGLFWVQLYLLTMNIRTKTGPGSPGGKLTHRIAFWSHAVATFHIFLPWLRLRRLQIQADKLSNHAVRLRLKEKVSNCVVYRISASPLGEWHSFACIPERNGPGGSLIVANAGDWTRKLIDAPRERYYTRGTPTVGVLCMAQIFRKVVVVTTGSGIGPCLGTMMGIPKTTCRVLWSVPDPWKNFGDEICKAVLEIDAEAEIIDTSVQGRPDLVQLAYELYIESGAEAIFCISNRTLTRKLVYAMESVGVPAYGPIWDS